MFVFGSAILHANNPLKNVSSQFLLLCKTAAQFHLGYTSARVVRINWQLCWQSRML